MNTTINHALLLVFVAIAPRNAQLSACKCGILVAAVVSYMAAADQCRSIVGLPFGRVGFPYLCT
jgi:hypothetical protein